MAILRVAMGQFNPTVGAIGANTDRMVAMIADAKKAGADLIVFPELAVTGYPPEDLLFKPRFIRQNRQALERLAEASEGIISVVGCVDAGEDVYNAAAVLLDGKIHAVYHKVFLPNYGVFDEMRYFQKGNEAVLLEIDGYKVGLSVCEDLWYPENPITVQAVAGAEVILSLNASPFTARKAEQRRELLRVRSRENLAAFVYVNQVGGQDELVFDGKSMVVNADGKILAKGAAFAEDLVLCDLELESIFRKQLKDNRLRFLRNRSGNWPVREVSIPYRLRRDRPALPVREVQIVDTQESIYEALKLGLSDYMDKHGFGSVVIGLSGGVDSALVATVAADALGPDRVKGVLMPSPYSSGHSVTDAEALAKNLGIETLTLSIADLMARYDELLAPVFTGREADVTEENLQARIRGNLLMALSNKFGWIVVATGNKSEMSVGYSTLYGDMVGGFALLKDIPKTLVYSLCSWRNRKIPVIPENVLTKAPSAELRPDQVDQDSLPPYELLDQIIASYVEEDLSIAEMVAQGLDEATIRRVVGMIDRNEYKRRQAPPGIKITDRSFGKDRRMPIVNGYKED